MSRNHGSGRNFSLFSILLASIVETQKLVPPIFQLQRSIPANTEYFACYRGDIMEIFPSKHIVGHEWETFLKPIIFMLGLSGVGKDYACCVLKEDCSLLHKDMDRKRAFERAGLSPEWDKNILLVDFGVLATHIRNGLASDHQGAVLSFPTREIAQVNTAFVSTISGVSAFAGRMQVRKMWKLLITTEEIPL
jgi:hypothetical protein